MPKDAYDELQFKDDFLFCKILTLRPDLAKDLLELILKIKIKKVDIKKQLPIEITSDGRGIRLDVYVEDESSNTVFDIEMQTSKKTEIPKRSRYYQGMIDLNLIERGAKFKELKQSYVIFICMQDPFGEGRHIYTFQNLCLEDPSLRLNDETTKVFLNASGEIDDVSDELKDFFNLLKTGQGNIALSRAIQAEVINARSHTKWRAEYMTLYMRDMENQEIGFNTGKLHTLVTLVNENAITPEVAASQLSISVEEFLEIMKGTTLEEVSSTN